MTDNQNMSMDQVEFMKRMKAIASDLWGGAFPADPPGWKRERDRRDGGGGKEGRDQPCRTGESVPGRAGAVMTILPASTLTLYPPASSALTTALEDAPDRV